MQVAGAPVEAAVSPDGHHLWVSNYKMYGDEYRSDADDGCDRGDWEDSYGIASTSNVLRSTGWSPQEQYQSS